MDDDMDLNFVEPSLPAPPSRGRIEDRIRLLEAVAGQRQRWQRIMNNPALNYMSVIEPRNESEGDRMRNRKRDITQVAKALEMDSDGKKTDHARAAAVHGDGDGDGVDGNNFFDCNICLGMARDPVLTCCGHLFCWGCFYQVPYVDSISKECPVCKGEVIDSNVTPIYGNGRNSEASMELEFGVKIPPRPHARRVESVRQQSFSQENPSEAEFTSLSVISSALANPERFFQDLESYISRRPANREGHVEIDVAISRPRRRGARNFEGGTSMQLRRRRLR